jgi:hypothetical protein
LPLVSSPERTRHPDHSTKLAKIGFPVAAARLSAASISPCRPSGVILQYSMVPNSIGCGRRCSLRLVFVDRSATAPRLLGVICVDVALASVSGRAEELDATVAGGSGFPSPLRFCFPRRRISISRKYILTIYRKQTGRFRGNLNTSVCNNALDVSFSYNSRTMGASTFITSANSEVAQEGFTHGYT